MLTCDCHLAFFYVSHLGNHGSNASIGNCSSYTDDAAVHVWGFNVSDGMWTMSTVEHTFVDQKPAEPSLLEQN